MKIQREWATPLTIGAFAVLAVTGVLMFFHLDSGANKAVHEWASWLLLAAVGLHLVVNFASFKRYFASRTGRALMAAGVLLLAVSFVPLGSDGGKPPFVAPISALARAPLPVVASVAGVSADTLQQRLLQAGLKPTGEGDSIASLVGNDLGAQMRLLSKLMAPATGG